VSFFCRPLRIAGSREPYFWTLIEDGRRTLLNYFSNANMAWDGRRSAFSSRRTGGPFLQSTLLNRRMAAGPHEAGTLDLCALKQAHFELGMACTLGDFCYLFNQQQGSKSGSPLTFVWQSGICPKPLPIWSKERLVKTSGYRQLAR
jgi:hypothetical protein